MARERRRRRRRERRRERRQEDVTTVDPALVDQRVDQEIQQGRDLGRDLEQEFLSAEAVAAGRTQEDKDLLALREAQLEGISPEEELQIREAGLAAQAKEFALADRLLGGSAIGRVRGRAGASRFNPLLRNKFESRNALERDIASQKLDRRAQALSAFEQAQAGVQARDTARAQQAFDAAVGSIGARTSLSGGLRGEEIAREEQDRSRRQDRRQRRRERREARRFEKQSQGLF